MIINPQIVERWQFADDIFSPSFRIDGETAEFVLIIRLLSGTARLSITDIDSFFMDLPTNFIRPDHELDENNIGLILGYIFDEIPDNSEISALFQRAKLRNTAFYRDIREELTYCLIGMERGRFTESFLFLYRIIERISAACPLLYISRERDFRTAHSFLTGIFSDNKTPGELGLLQSFLKSLSVSDDNFRNNSLDFALEDALSDHSINILQQWNSVIKREVPSISIDFDSGIINCPFPDVASLIVTVRNRSFHNKSSHPNLNLVKIGGPDELFRFVMPKFLHWFSFMFLEFARWQIASEQS